MKNSDQSYATIAQINVKLLTACGCAFIAYWAWPTEAKYWGYGFITICLGLASIGIFFDALRMMAKLYHRNKIMATYMAQGEKPKSSKMASEEALRKSGMFDDQ